MVITGLTRNQFGSNPTRVRIPSSPPILTKNTFETIGFERVFLLHLHKRAEIFFEIFQGFSASLQNPGNACCIRLFGHRKILVRGIFRCFFCPVFVFFECFLRVFNLFSAFLRCPMHSLCRQIRAASRLFPSLQASRFCHPN